MLSISQSLKFAQGAIKKNKINPELEHYQIKNGEIVGFNGYMALGAPIDLAIEAHPKAALFFKALEACGETISINLTDGGRLSIRSGKFAAYVPCIDREVYTARPEGVAYEAPEGFGAACRKLLPFISEDASRPWAMGLCSKEGSLTATNNIIIIQQWIGGDLPVFNCPKFAIAEIARVGEDPKIIQVSPTSLTFHFEDGRWLRTQQLSDEWPHATVDNILSGAKPGTPVGPELFDGLRTIAPFTPPETTAIRFEDGRITTGNEGAGASVEVEVPAGPLFSAPMIKLLEGVAQTIDFSAYPNPCGFFGENCRGVILGLRE